MAELAGAKIFVEKFRFNIRGKKKKTSINVERLIDFFPSLFSSGADRPPGDPAGRHRQLLHWEFHVNRKQRTQRILWLP